MKAILTTIGKDQVGIVANVSQYLAQKQINILDLSQTIMDGYFTMMMMVEIPTTVAIEEVASQLNDLGKQLGVEINIRNEEIYRAMHQLQEGAGVETEKILETARMISDENLDVRTITMAISLIDCIDSDSDKACQKIYDKITTKARDLVKVGEQIQAEYGIPIINKRVTVTPISIIAAASHDKDYVKYALTLDKAAKTLGIDFIGGFSALVD